MSIKDSMVAGLATKRIQRIEPMRIANLSISENEPYNDPARNVVIRQMNLNLSVRFSDDMGEQQAKEMLMKTLFGEVVEKLNAVQYQLRNGLIEESVELLNEIKQELI